MNSSLTPQQTSASPGPAEDDVDLGHYLDILLANKWLIAAVTALILLIGIAYAAMARPVYEANMLIQIEDIAEGGGGKGAASDEPIDVAGIKLGSDNGDVLSVGSAALIAGMAMAAVFAYLAVTQIRGISRKA